MIWNIRGIQTLYTIIVINIICTIPKFNGVILYYTQSVKYCHSDEENFSLLANMRPNHSIIFCHV